MEMNCWLQIKNMKWVSKLWKMEKTRRAVDLMEVWDEVWSSDWSRLESLSCHTDGCIVCKWQRYNRMGMVFKILSSWVKGNFPLLSGSPFVFHWSLWGLLWPGWLGISTSWWPLGDIWWLHHQISTLTLTLMSDYIFWSFHLLNSWIFDSSSTWHNNCTSVVIH